LDNFIDENGKSLGQFGEQALIMAYKGSASPELLNNILLIAEHRINMSVSSKKMRKKLFNILIETFQNIYHHFLETEVASEIGGPVVFALGIQEGAYKVMVGNLVNSEDKKSLQQALDDVNAMNKDEIKAHYRELLDNGHISDKGGAGLGIVDIAKKSGSRLDYEFEERESNLFFFSLKVDVKP